MHVRRLAFGTAFVAGACALAACSNMSMPTMPGMSTPTASAPNAPAAPTAPAMPGMPAAPAMPTSQQAAQAAQAQAAQTAQGMIVGNLMSAALSGATQVPPNSTTGSGAASIKLDGDVLSWVVTYSGLTGPVTGAHFHGPAPANANAGVIVPFAGSLGSPIQGSQKLTAAQIAGLRGGLWYVNLHTAAFPGGEIRGQVTAVK
jgi:CHRD domain